MTTDTTYCPSCGTIDDYKITMMRGRQILQCRKCKKRFVAEVSDREFTGRNR